MEFRFFNPDLRVEGGGSAEDMDRGKCLFFHVESESGVRKNRIFEPNLGVVKTRPRAPGGERAKSLRYLA